MKLGAKRTTPYRVVSIIVMVILARLFLLPLYWIVTGSMKPVTEILNPEPSFFPKEFTMNNFDRLFAKRTAPLWELAVPFSSQFSASHRPAYFSVGPIVPAAFRWLINTVFMAVAAMIITCITASMAGYALAKKRFRGRGILFSLIVCAMALPKQVILIPLIKEISALFMWDNLWAVIVPTVGWPFGVFLMKQFSESVPGEILEAARIDGASEWFTFYNVVTPMIKPGIGALAIFTFINSWNDYFLQLIMLGSGSNYTISLGIATLQSETSIDLGILMAGAALAAIPIIIVFLIFQKYFTQGITMGAVKG